MADLDRLDGRIIAITGASKGMGLRFARALAAEGVKVVLLARPSSQLDEAAKEIAGALAIPCDVAQAEEVRRAFRIIAGQHGKLDALINNAGACLIHKIEDTTDQEIATEIGANLQGPIHCIREAIPLLRAAGGGDIINVSSESVLAPIPYLTLYAATKAALESLSRGLRVELKPDKIRVTVLRSGHVAESSLGNSWDPARAQQFHTEIIATGMAGLTGPGVAPETMASMLVQLLKLPREAILDLVEIRAFD